MKKFISLIFGTLLISSCTTIKDAVIVKMDGWAHPVNSTEKPIDVTIYEYNGHTYLIFGRSTLINGVVHNPDCICNKTEEGKI